MGDQDPPNTPPAAQIPAIVEELRRELRRERRPEPLAVGQRLFLALTAWAQAPASDPPTAEFREALCLRATVVQEATASAIIRLVHLEALGPAFIHTMLDRCTAPGRLWFAACLEPLASACPQADGTELCRRLLLDRSKRVRELAIERCITCNCAQSLLPTLKAITAADAPEAASLRHTINLIEHGFSLAADEYDAARRHLSVLVPPTPDEPARWHTHSVSTERLNQLGEPEVARRLRELWSRGQPLPHGVDP